MQGTRTYPLPHLYLDESATQNTSNLALGLIIRALGHNLNVCYINKEKSPQILKLKEILKQFTFEIQTTPPKTPENFELIIFDNITSTPQKIENEKSEIIHITHDKKTFQNLEKNNYELISSITLEKGKKEEIPNKKGIITGNGKGKSTTSFGILTTQILQNKPCSLIYFDKGGDFYGERKIFDTLKQHYKNFNYHITGLQRFDGKHFRFLNTEKDIEEAKKGLQLLKEQKTGTFTIAEELNTTIGTKLLEEEEIRKTLNSNPNPIYSTGRFATPNLIKDSQIHIEVSELLHYGSKGHGVRKGIDF